jgi:hypothetical protein
MKKFYVVLVVIAMVFVSSLALAAEVTLGGNVSIRSRDFNDLNLVKGGQADTIDTQTKMIINVNAKADGVKGKLSLWNDFSSWGTLDENAKTDTITRSTNTFSEPSVSAFGFREAWVSFDLPGIPVNVTAGHQLLQIANGWFFVSKHFGSDAWVISNVTGNNTAIFVDVKAAEGKGNRSDDVDAYVIMDVYKLNETSTVGANLTNVRMGTSDNALQNIGLFYNGKLGPVDLKAQLDFQMGEDKTNPNAKSKYKGNEIVITGNVPVDPVTINFALARGSGPKENETDTNQYVNLLDIDPHYTFLYEYKIPDICGDLHQGFCNTTAISVGAMFAASKTLGIGLDLWFLQSTEKVADKVAGSGTTNEIGTEIDAKVNWKLYDNLTWNWVLGYFDPGKGMGKDPSTGIQGILSMTF